jgi:hypothetical protein
MTPYTVDWDSTAEDQLADIWLRSPDPGAITAAQAAIDRLLASNPLGHGVDVREGLRKITVPPLTVFYEVHAPQPVVQVSAVTYTP